MSAQSKGYNIKVSAKKIAGQTRVEIYNRNAFKLLDLDVEIRKQGESRSYHIDSIAAKSSWCEGQRTKKYLPFQKVGLYEGKSHRIDCSLYDETAGIYRGMPHHAMVWPELDEEKDWNRQLQYAVGGAEVNVSFVARGPRMAFCGHSFTGLWDSVYYYFRELAKMGGWNAQIAYSYWGGTGISGYAGLVPGCEMRAQQCRRLLQSNDYYDFFTVAGNSDEAVETRSGLVGDVEYKQRKTMQQGAFLLHKMAKEKEAATILWVPHAYQYGFFQNMEVKPWREGRVGEFYEKDGKKYLLTLSQEEMAIANDRWYHELAESLGGDVLAAPVSMAYHKVYTAYGERVNPYLGPGAECGDCGHQNNIGNYISACVYYHLIFGEAVEAENVPVSHTWGMDGGSVTKKQAEWIRKTVNEMFREEEQK